MGHKTKSKSSPHFVPSSHIKSLHISRLHYRSESICDYGKCSQPAMIVNYTNRFPALNTVENPYADSLCPSEVHTAAIGCISALCLRMGRCWLYLFKDEMRRRSGLCARSV